MIKVVIVEDEDIIRRGLVKTIDWQEMGAEIVGEAADGKEGLEVVRTVKPDLVMTDVKMPRLDGLEMAAQLRQEYPELKLVFLTSYAEFDYAQQAVRLGAEDYLLKPVDEEQIRKLMARLIEAQRAEESGKAEIWEQLGLVDWQEALAHQGLNPHVRRVLETIEANYKEKLSIEELANDLAVSPSYLSRKLKEATGHTFVGLLARYRLQEAVKLLALGSYRVYEVAEHTGFGEYKNFCQIFKKYLAVSPKRFMQEREAKMTEDGVVAQQQ